MGNIANSRKKETRPEQTEFKNMDPQPTRPEQTEFKSMDPQPIEKSVNFNTAVGKVIHLKKDLKPREFKNKTTIPLKSLIGDFIKVAEKSFPEDRRHVQNMSPTWGTDEVVHKGQCGRAFDMGFFSTIMECYNNHWALKTAPDDWWCTIVRTIAIAIDNNSKNEKVRKLFVDHEGKKTLTVDVNGCNIDFEKFFKDMTNQIQNNIKIDEFVDAIRSDFSTSTPTHQIVSEIMIMTSLQEFFEFKMRALCGIPYIELLGTEEDWENLKIKLLKLKGMLEPIEKEIHLDGWWDEVASVFDQIHESFKGNVDTEWWSNILRITKSDFCGSGGPDVFYDGWFITKILNKKYRLESLNSIPTGLASVPLTINNNGVKSKSAIVSGIA